MTTVRAHRAGSFQSRHHRLLIAQSQRRGVAPRFPDVSRYQAGFDPQAYAAACRAQPDQFAPLVIVNADGNPDFGAQWQAAGAAGLIRGAYSWATPGEDGAQDADRLVAQVKAAGGWGPRDFPVDDLEQAPAGNVPWSPSEPEPYLASWAARIAASWRPGWIYVGYYFAVQYRLLLPAGCRWWPAAYPGPPWQVPSWPEPVAHQYTGAALDIPGMPAGVQGDESYLFDKTVLGGATPSVHPEEDDVAAVFIQRNPDPKRTGVYLSGVAGAWHVGSPGVGDLLMQTGQATGDWRRPVQVPGVVFDAMHFTDTATSTPARLAARADGKDEDNEAVLRAVAKATGLQVAAP